MIFLAPGEAEVDISGLVAECSARLGNLPGKKFLLLPVSDPADAIPWILASFRSPLAVVPYSASLPAPALAKIAAQLPAAELAYFHEVPPPGPANDFQKPPGEIWAVLFSSGSSGDPKGVAITGNNLRASAEAHAKHPAVSGGPWLLNLPLFHVGGFSVISRAFFLGSKVAIAGQKFSAEETLAWISKSSVAGLSLVPTSLRRLLAFTSSLPPSLRMILVGGAPMPPDLIEEARKVLAPVFQTYGMTEHCSQIATEREMGSGLLPLPGVEIKLTPEGEILVRSACLAKGYYRGGGLEMLPSIDGFFPTGDLGEQKEGKLFLLGRKSDLIISGGMNIFPAEIENELSGYAGLADFGVVGIPHPEWGEVVALAVVPAEAGFDLPALLKYLRGRLDSRKVPKHAVELSQIPRSSIGKVARSELRAAIEKKILPAR